MVETNAARISGIGRWSARVAGAVLAGAALTALALPSVAQAQAPEKVTLVLNWVPTADHAAYYYAKQQGLYAKAGIDLSIEVGRGSALSAQKVGSGGAAFGVSDLATSLVAKGKGADLAAVMIVYANSPQGFYWLKSSGIAGPKDFAGRKIGNPPGDAARIMWPAFAKAVGLDPASVTFVNITPQAKNAALKSRTVDVISDFFNEHDTKVIEMGEDLVHLPWKQVGLNPYGNAVIVNGAFLQAKPAVVENFVKISQRAFAQCVADFTPCLKALTEGVSGLDEATQRRQWERIKWLMTDSFTTEKGLGWIDGDRLKADYELVQTYIGLDKPFDPASVFTTRFLDPAVKMDASKVKN
ncbi:ABC transporter substrate-binding protein [Rhodoplanes serenus]|uniref:ABC transporter substrate-binding protein n=1 Tax=Rhodoplanes serenus TaxID=200615 RepID=UPI000DAB9FD5|nr:ABC transporter substrate-binding protein [Rhodoplanes serenus]RAI35303.1 nitrate ABC transporter substrate-binding protein [Rhodoplanes serenus]